MSAQTTQNFMQDTELSNISGFQTLFATALKHSHRTL